MASIIHLIRHGEVHNPTHLVYASLPGFSLTESGREQAKQAGRHLGNRPVVAVWASPLERALATAAEVADRFGLPVMVEEDLIEWRLLDRWAGQAWDALGVEFPGEVEAYLHDPTQLPFAGESLARLATRSAGAIVRLAERYPDGELVIVSHQDPIQAARLHLTGGDLAKLHVDKPGHGSVISLRPGRPWEEIWMTNPASAERGE